MNYNDKKFLTKLTQQYLKCRQGLEFSYSDIYQLIGHHDSRDNVDLIDFAMYVKNTLLKEQKAA